MSNAVAAPSALDIGATLAAFRHGRHDPTTVLRNHGTVGEFVHATLTPHGPGTVHIRWVSDQITVASYGAGGQWLEAHVPMMLGDADAGMSHVDTSGWDPAVTAAVHRRRGVRIGSSGNLYHHLLPTVIEQRITSLEALRQWRALCGRLGEPAPGPFEALRLPPAPDVVRTSPTWWFHSFGIERKRAATLIEVARHAPKYWDWVDQGVNESADKLALIPGVGRWTIGSVLTPALGDPDAVAVGDYHLKNVVAYALAGEPRATDERMLEVLEPYRGQRGRVIAALVRAGRGAPKYGPRRRIMPISAW